MDGIEAFTDQVKRDFVELPRKSALRRSADVAERFGMALDAAMAAKDATTVYVILDRLLDEAKTPLVVFRRLVQFWGGELIFTRRIEMFLAQHGDNRSDIIGILSGKGTIAMRIVRRLNNDLPPEGGFDPAELSALVGEGAALALPGLTALAATNPLVPAVLIGGSFYVLKPHIDEVLLTAKNFWSDFADTLADSDDVFLATAVQTLNDLFVPGSSFEAVLTALPIGRLGVLIKAVFLKAAALVGLKLVARGFKEIARLLLKFVRDLIDTHISSKLLSFENNLATRIATTTSPAERKALVAQAFAFLKRVNQTFSFDREIDEVIRAAQKAGKLSKAAISKLKGELKAFFPLPPGSPAKLAFDVLPDGKVVQTVRTTLSSNPVGRTIEDLAGLAEKHQLVSNPGEHWAHIAANRLSGDDALYNLVRAESRLNVSFMKVFDSLPPGMVVEVRILFDSFGDTLGRYARRVEYTNADTGELIGALPNLLKQPPQTLDQIKREAFDLAQRLGALGLDETANQIIQQLADYFNLGKL
jgi:hypothetical protein